MIERLPHFVWRLFRFLPPRLAYSLGLGPIAGRAVLLLTTIGRRSGLPRVTPLLYDEIDGNIYVASARGEKADWYRNLLANRNVEVTVGSRRFSGCADTITDPLQVADFLERRLKLHPMLATAVMRIEGLGKTPSREQLEQYARRRTLVAIRLTDDAGLDDTQTYLIAAGQQLTGLLVMEEIMDWMGFDWDGDGYVDFEESMMTFTAFRMIHLQRQNQLMQQEIDYLRENPDFIDDLPIGWEYGASYYPSSSRSGISLEELFNPIGDIFSRFFRFIYTLLVSLVRGWNIIFQRGQASFKKLIQEAGFTKHQVIFLSALVLFTMIIIIAIGVLMILTIFL